MKIILPAPRNLTGVSLTGGNRKLRSLHREIQLSTAILLFRNINNMKLAVVCSDSPDILKKQKKLLSDLKSMLESLVFTCRKRQEFTSIPEVKKILKTMEYRMQKNKTTKARYSTDKDFRERQKEKMRAWRKNSGNAERERLAAKTRRAKAARWKKFCATI
jgi:hypothetical protein